MPMLSDQNGSLSHFWFHRLTSVSPRMQNSVRPTFVECFDPATNSCVVNPACNLRLALAGALEAFARYLDQFTVADLVPNNVGYRQLLDAQLSHTRQ